MPMVLDTLDLGRAIFWDVLTIAMDEHEKQYTQFVNEAHTTQQFERIGQVTAFGYPQYGPEGSPVPTDARRKLYQKDFYPGQFGVAYDFTDKAKFTDQYGKYAENPRLAARSMMQGRELACANILNNSFSSSYTGADTKSLINTAHLTNGGATWSNKPAAVIALGTDALRQGKAEMRKVKDPRNMPMAFTGKVRLIVPPALETTADILLTDGPIPFTANHGANRYKDRVTERLVLDELTSDTAWWLQAIDSSAHGMFILYGMPVTVGTDRVNNTLTTKTTTSEERVTGWKHPYGIWGTEAA